MFDLILTVSSFEREILLKKGFPSEQLVLGGSSQDIVDTRGGDKKWDLLFVGASGNWPNLECMNWFLEFVWPEILAENPQVELVIAGSIGGILTENQKSLANVRIVGFVTDLAEAYSSSRIAIVPLLSGSGVKIKLVEALAHCKPVISTDIGAEGLPLKNGTHYLQAEGAQEWISTILQLLSSLHEQLRLENAAHDWACKHASAEAVWGPFERSIREKAVS